jgi:thiosulfate/3-mercaptopyruvate sulfurtransferase
MPETSGYPNAGLLETTEWLAEHVDDPDVVIVDARPAEEYAQGHIPGAIHIPGNAFKQQGSLETASASEFAEAVGALGIRPSDTVICYDHAGPQAARIWWAFTRFGHERARYLHGGIRKWQAEGRSLSTEPASRPVTTYTLGTLHDEVACSLPHAIDLLDADDVLFWDTRSPEELTGERAMNNPPDRLGKIPGAVHLEWRDLTDPETGLFLPADQMRRALVDAGITPEKEVVAY